MTGKPELSVQILNFLFAEAAGIVNTPLPTNVYHLLGILRAWPGPVTEETCSRRAFDRGL